MASDAELLEVFRLAEAADLPDIVCEVGDHLAWNWISRSRFPEVDQLSRRSLAVQTSAGTLLAAGRALRVLGKPADALRYYQQALPIQQEASDRAGEAATLSNIGLVHHNRGNLDQALHHYQQALTISQEVGDRAGEATTLNNIGKVHHDRGEPDQALDYLQQVLLIKREIGDRVGEATTLNDIAAVHRARGDLDGGSS